MYTIKKHTVVLGGHDSWLRVIRTELRGNIRYLGRDERFDPEVIRGAQVIWVQSNSVSHKRYNVLLSEARTYGKTVNYFTCAGTAGCLRQIIQEDKK